VNAPCHDLASMLHTRCTRGFALPLDEKKEERRIYRLYTGNTALHTNTHTHQLAATDDASTRPRARCRRAELPTPRPARVHARVRVAPPCTNVASCSTTQLTPLTQKRLLPRAPSAHPAPYHVRARKARLSFEFSAAPPQSPSLLRPRCDRVLRPSHSHSSSFPLARTTRRSARSPR
jgi:hypothetical protein